MRKFLVIIMVLITSLAAVFGAVYASSYVQGQIVLTCTGWVGMNNNPNAFVFDRNNVPGQPGFEAFRLDFFDGAGNLLWTNSATIAHGGYATNVGENWTTLPQYNPLRMSIVSLAGNGLPEVEFGVEMGNCDGLPTFVPPVEPDVTNPTCPLSLDGAVVGDMPFSTQAFYEPGKEAPGVVINAGTYWVLGTDEGGAYYKLLISCQYLWVPVGSMQPSFQPPQSGQALPMQVVS